ncbi:MAG: peptidase S10 [Alphaproteobacteria bacterium]|nr:peptidase S10 [Alphaproteobacteria bacterium]MBU1515297.1 peptidase S10 [Alphaproteobacteria bacterium]MBU2092427.1 peptidase S10 [Alphaproteobacteria bacterium]MBU2153021.1 peptidase S10 [Alphaproteobacteria bacterium]MBU2305852.1 peptidase S10 [Alphaproteobacteria bacterium]
MQRLTVAAGLALGLATAAPALALPSAEAPVVTPHRITVGGKPLAYTAEVGRIAIRDAETGEPRGWMGYVAYRVASPGKPRPIAFVWNGGPGANSATLHFEVAGPKRGEAAGLVDNQETWLTDADLVFVDPIGTGFSRPAKAEDADAFYGTLGDVASVTEFVRSWRLLHGTQANPLYLIGESWGAGRAANVGYALLKRGVPVSGLGLISGGSGLSRLGDDGPVAPLKIVGFTATAFHLGKLAPDVGATSEAVEAATANWVRDTYAPALARRDQLTAEERDRIAASLARFTGVPADKIDHKSLTITPRQFRTQLIPGKTLNTFDMRLSDEPRESSRTAILAYLRGDLGYRTDLPYVGLESQDDGFLPDGKPVEPVGARWDYATAKVTPEQRQAAYAEAVRTGAGPPSLGPPLPGTAEAVALNPKLKVLVASGLYDSLANCAGAAETGRTLPAPLGAAMSFRCYPGGHMMYRDTPTRLQFSRDIRALVSSSLP